MNPEPVQWSEEKQQRLQERLVGCWAEDNWELKGYYKDRKCSLHFSCTSSSLKTELKYALWYKFDTGERDVRKRQDSLCRYITLLAAWLNQVAPTTRSLLEKPLENWIWSLRSYLVETNQLQQPLGKHLLATQEYMEYIQEDPRITLFRQCYKIVCICQ